MFDRVRIKEMAKTALKRRYWIVVLVAVLVGLLGGSLADGLTGGDRLNLNLNLSDNDVNVEHNDPDAGIWMPETEQNPWLNQGNDNAWDQYNEDDSPSDLWAEIVAIWNETLEELSAELGVDLQTALSVFAGVLIAIVTIAALVAALFKILLSNVMTVSGHGWMLRHWRGEEVSVGESFAAFRIYKPSVVTMLVRGIYTWLWSLLFVIPGIVKGFAYSMVPYIIYENPNLTANQAISMSKKMTHGYKGDLFVLSLSFWGWKLLSGITGGLVGIFWANPYMGLTHAGVYEDLKWKAIQSGTLTWENFGQLPPAPADPFANAWGDSAPQQSAWSNPAPQQPIWGNPAPTTPPAETWNNPPDTNL